MENTRGWVVRGRCRSCGGPLRAEKKLWIDPSDLKPKVKALCPSPGCPKRYVTIILDLEEESDRALLKRFPGILNPGGSGECKDLE